MSLTRFEDIIAWQKAQELAILVYSNIKVKDRDFQSQIRRASVSISNNIAEGFDRRTNADFIRFLYYSSSSSSEVRSMLYLAEGLEYIKREEAIELRNRCLEVSKIIGGLIRSLNTNKK